MTVGELIIQLSALKPELEVLTEVNSDVNRTGEYVSTDLQVLSAYPVSYGGFVTATPDDKKGMYATGETRLVVVFMGC